LEPGADKSSKDNAPLEFALEEEDTEDVDLCSEDQSLEEEDMEEDTEDVDLFSEDQSQEDQLILTATATKLRSTDVDLTLSPLKLAETKSSPNVVSDAQLKTSPTALNMQLTDVPPSQPSLEPGADKSSKDNALQELKDFNQLTNQKDAIVTDNLLRDVDLTLSQTLTAETNLLKNALVTAHLPELTVQTVQLMQMQDALTSPPSLEEPAETLFSQLVNKDVLHHHHHLNQFMLHHQLSLFQLLNQSTLHQPLLTSQLLNQCMLPQLLNQSTLHQPSLMSQLLNQLQLTPPPLFNKLDQPLLTPPPPPLTMSNTLEMKLLTPKLSILPPSIPLQLKKSPLKLNM
jgi:hypothetical protein